FFFFFQAEDGIRDFHVTGVQTCALPISPASIGYEPPGRSSGGEKGIGYQRTRYLGLGHRGKLGDCAYRQTSPPYWVAGPVSVCRSEEHTSELQSRENLVCRLLLEKKKKK